MAVATSTLSSFFGSSVVPTSVLLTDDLSSLSFSFLTSSAEHMAAVSPRK
jgi:hypothetical protein